ncbi:hypothetical protein ACRRJ4_003443 [Escherichia coli]
MSVGNIRHGLSASFDFPSGTQTPDWHRQCGLTGITGRGIKGR